MFAGTLVFVVVLREKKKEMRVEGPLSGPRKTITTFLWKRLEILEFILGKT